MYSFNTRNSSGDVRTFKSSDISEKDLDVLEKYTITMIFIVSIKPREIIILHMYQRREKTNKSLQLFLPPCKHNSILHCSFFSEIPKHALR